jgi:biotin transport system permease protein
MIPFAYRSGPSPLHRCPAALKLAGLLALSVGAFYSVYGLAAGAVLLAAGALTAGFRPWELLRGSKTVVALAVLLILVRSLRFGEPGLTAGPQAAGLPVLSAEGFWGGLHQGLCFILSFAAGTLLFAVTTMQELRDSLGGVEAAAINRFLRLARFFRPGTRGGPPVKRRAYSGFSLGLSLMLGFLPRFFEIWENANLAFDARAGKRGLRRLIILIPLVIERMMESAGETAEALDSRGLSLLLEGELLRCS